MNIINKFHIIQLLFLPVCDKIFKIYTIETPRKKQVKSIVTKTALKTLLAAIIAILVVFAAVSLGFPQHMATMFENLGSYSIATGYAGLAYKYNGTVENLARCVDDSIFAGSDANIVKYGEKLVTCGDFAEYSVGRTEESGIDYYHFVYSNLACAAYNRGDKDGAFERAQESMQDVDGFPENNALAALAIRSVESSDGQFSQKLYQEILTKAPTAEQQDYYLAVIDILS